MSLGQLRICHCERSEAISRVTLPSTVEIASSPPATLRSRLRLLAMTLLNAYPASIRPRRTAFQGGPLEPLELLVGHKAVRAPVQSLSSDLTTSALFGVYLYTPYSLVKSTIALRFSGFAWSKNDPLAMIKPPPLPAVSMSFLA